MAAVIVHIQVYKSCLDCILLRHSTTKKMTPTCALKDYLTCRENSATPNPL